LIALHPASYISFIFSALTSSSILAINGKRQYGNEAGGSQPHQCHLRAIWNWKWRKRI